MEKQHVSLSTLFFIFLKLGLFTFGGGFVIIPLMHTEMVEKRGWISDDDIMDILTIAESTPGPISINASTFIGYKVRGFWGALVSTAGLVLPSLIIISALAYVYHQIVEIPLINHAFRGILAAVVILIASATLKLGKKVQPTLFNLLLLLAAFVASFIFKVNAIYIILAGAVIGISYYSLLKKEEKQ